MRHWSRYLDWNGNWQSRCDPRSHVAGLDDSRGGGEFRRGGPSPHQQVQRPVTHDRHRKGDRDRGRLIDRERTARGQRPAFVERDERDSAQPVECPLAEREAHRHTCFDTPGRRDRSGR
jgi:hypothetical protein